MNALWCPSSEKKQYSTLPLVIVLLIVITLIFIVLNTAENCCGEYVYVWMEGRWTVIDMDKEKGYILADLVDTITKH